MGHEHYTCKGGLSSALSVEELFIVWCMLELHLSDLEQICDYSWSQDNFHLSLPGSSLSAYCKKSQTKA